MTVIRALDALDRVTFVDYPGEFVDVAYTYDDPAVPHSKGPDPLGFTEGDPNGWKVIRTGASRFVLIGLQQLTVPHPLDQPFLAALGEEDIPQALDLRPP